MLQQTTYFPIRRSSFVDHLRSTSELSTDTTLICGRILESQHRTAEPVELDGTFPGRFRYSKKTSHTSSSCRGRHNTWCCCNLNYYIPYNPLKIRIPTIWFFLDTRNSIETNCQNIYILLLIGNQKKRISINTIHPDTR